MTAEVKNLCFSVNTLSEIFRLDPGTIRWWIRNGKLQANREGPRGQFTITGEQFIAFLKKNPNMLFDYKNAQDLPLMQEKYREVILAELQNFPKLYSFVELTSIFCISKCAIYYWIQQGYIPVAGYDSFHAPTFTKEGIEQFLERSQQYRKKFTDYNRREIQC